MASPRKGCCNVLHLHEDNARFLLLALVMVAYMLLGAVAFHFTECGHEDMSRQHYQAVLANFWAKYNETVNKTDLEQLLQEYGSAFQAGLINKRPRWDLPGAFYFVGTVVSTIGFGMTTPQTIGGKILVVFYGFLGCSGAFLFFNLFLERIITFLAYVLRYFHEMDLRRKGVIGGDRRDSQASYDDTLDQWKPSVYWVMLYLFLACVVLAICASALYSPVEKWTYFESLYFCFVAFATIGFGDYVSSQQPYYDNVEWYRLGNFFVIVCGSCFMYSLFNVTTIVIKQFLNWLIQKLDCRCTYLKKTKIQIRPPIPRGRRNAITPEHLKHANRTAPPKTVADISEPDSTYDSEGERRNSNEMISMQDFLKSNKVSLAVMQKELHESALRGRAIILPSRPPVEEFKPGSVGPLAIACKKLGEDIA